MSCLVAIVNCTHVHYVVLSTKKQMHTIFCCYGIADSAHVGSATASFKDSGTGELNQTSDVLI